MKCQPAFSTWIPVSGTHCMQRVVLITKLKGRGEFTEWAGRTVPY